jgi:hypothetical protein
MHIDDAVEFILDFIRTPRTGFANPGFGYEISLQSILLCYLREIEHLPEYIQYPQDQARGRELSAIFYDAAWELCRRGIFRPSVHFMGGQGNNDGSGYSLTTLGRRWINDRPPEALLFSRDRNSQLFEKLSERLGFVFFQRATEAAHCYALGVYVASCAMCGAAAEPILLAVAIAKSGNESAILASYRAANGRRKVIDGVVGQARQPISEQFRSAMGLLSYWRDDAAHGLASTISEIEAHEAVARLLRFAQFATDNWEQLTGS